LLHIVEGLNGQVEKVGKLNVVFVLLIRKG
jgi:hypothetical protein